ncbi:hypothetical protein DY000_02014059 [Brassica cretica]|uniref:Uncharacterized protein n=1 Tax=Brassica cretica TaxID=69181 RepID=A0ABQ7DAG6_BRACR|nr:hypothetical protein DY000_02014059 [Brassica cretica]
MVVNLLLSSTHLFQFVHVFDSESERQKKKLDAGGGVTGVVFEGRSTRGGDDDESTRKDSAIAAVSDAEDLEDADEPRMVFHRYKLLQRLSAGPISRAHAVLHLEA